MAERTTVSLSGDVLAQVVKEQQRLTAETKLEPSVSEVAKSLIKDGLKMRADAKRKGGR